MSREIAIKARGAAAGAAGTTPINYVCAVYHSLALP